MEKWIDADALKDWSEIVPLTGDGGIDINDFEEYLASMPAADVAPVRRGTWSVAIGYDPKRVVMCSECQRMAYEPSAFCPHCGAKMDGGE